MEDRNLEILRRGSHSFWPMERCDEEFSLFSQPLVEDEIGEIIAQHTDNTGIEEILILIISGAFDGNETHSTATEMAVISGTL